ncbi:MAG TPA: calcium-binding protein [Solirubrobacteraceae bacterium]|nr:calcium-binding protein [Solirubrobacteraceae bacterium]
MIRAGVQFSRHGGWGSGPAGPPSVRFLLLAVAVLVGCAVMAPATTAGTSAGTYSHANVIPGKNGNPWTIRFTAAKGEHVALTVSITACRSPYLDGTRCLDLEDAGSLIGYSYHVTEQPTIGHFFDFDYGCFAPHHRQARHHAQCAFETTRGLGQPAQFVVLLDLRRASSSTVRLDGVGVGDLKLIGSPGADTITGSAGATEELFGQDGADELTGAAHTSVVAGGSGDDILRATAGHSTLEGGAGNDTLVFTPGVGLRVRGGPGTDTLDFSHAMHRVKFHLGPAGSIEDVVGSPFADTLIGNAAANRLDGAGGDDKLLGGGGDDVLDGGAGNDVMVGGAGADTFAGGPGTDTVSYGRDPLPITVTVDGQANDGAAGEGDNVGFDVETVIGGSGDDLLDGGDNPHTLIGGPGDDVLIGGNTDDTLNGGDGNDRLAGGGGNDTLQGGAGNDQLDGGEGNDTIHGDTGDDTLDGGQGNDALDGGPGNDTLRGGPDDDVMTGGPGQDVFSCPSGSSDHVTDAGAGDQVGAGCA